MPSICPILLLFFTNIMNENLVFGSPIIEEAEIEEVVASMRSGWLGTGPKVARFEEDFKSYKGGSSRRCR